ncbi:MAG: hypothetical protein AAFV95_15300 [Bacteroidota bacterium]
MKHSTQDWNEFIPEYINDQLKGEQLKAFEAAMQHHPDLEQAVGTARDIRFVLMHRQEYQNLELARSLRTEDDANSQSGGSSRARGNSLGPLLWLGAVLIPLCMLLCFFFFQQHSPLMPTPYPVDQLGYFKEANIAPSIEMYKEKNYEESLQGIERYSASDQLPELRFLLMTNYYYLGKFDHAMALLPESRRKDHSLLAEQFDFYATLIKLEQGQATANDLQRFKESEDAFIQTQSKHLLPTLR